MSWLEPLSAVAASIRTAQSTTHRRLFELGDESHAGEPRACTRPVCARLLQDAAAIDRHAQLSEPD